MLYRKYAKRLLDVVFSGALLFILSPLLILLAIIIKTDTPGPVFFTQKRAGVNGNLFKMYKFRTMLPFEHSQFPDGTPMGNYERITRAGNILRKTSVDELPQLINILKGEMSIVGPRPALPYQVERYDEYQARRLLVRPGVTGLAQVSGRNELTWEQKIVLDVEYAENVTFLTDMKIVLKTVPVALKGQNVEFSKPDQISEHDGDIRKDVDT